MSRNVTTVTIPKPLADRIKDRIKGTGFNGVSSYITYVMRQVLSKVETRGDKQREPFTKEDEEDVKTRLRSLGYLD